MYLCHIVPRYMANLLRYLGRQCSELKVHRGDHSLSDGRSFVRNDVIANGISPISDILNCNIHDCKCSSLVFKGKQWVESCAVLYLNHVHTQHSWATASGEEEFEEKNDKLWKMSWTLSLCWCIFANMFNLVRLAIHVCWEWVHNCHWCQTMQT